MVSADEGLAGCRAAHRPQGGGQAKDVEQLQFHQQASDFKENWNVQIMRAMKSTCS